MAKKLNILAQAFDHEAWTWLQDANPRLADALIEEVTNGADPDEIERYVKAEYGNNREGLAKRMKSAARHLHATRAK